MAVTPEVQRVLDVARSLVNNDADQHQLMVELAEAVDELAACPHRFPVYYPSIDSTACATCGVWLGTVRPWSLPGS